MTKINTISLVATVLFCQGFLYTNKPKQIESEGPYCFGIKN
jgi:hypothetical protein